MKTSAVLRRVHARGHDGHPNADDLGISRNRLRCWRRELAQVNKERDFLKDAAAFFAKDRK